MPFSTGDIVRYVVPCSDHRNSPLVLDEVYVVSKIQGYSILLKSNGRPLWWVLAESIVPDEENYKATLVIRKIKQIDERRKAMGYEF
jgi:hypothetical protein